MKWVLSLLLFAVVAFGSHYLTVRMIPGFVMSKAQQMFAEQGLPQYQFVATARQTPETQRVVRPSPDLSYAICRFDVQDGPVMISAPGWDGYGSLSIFDDQTNNVFVASLDGQDAGVTIVSELSRYVEKPPLSGTSELVILNGTGLALIRRLAPSQIIHDEASDLVETAVCQQASWP